MTMLSFLVGMATMAWFFGISWIVPMTIVPSETGPPGGVPPGLSIVGSEMADVRPMHQMPMQPQAHPFMQTQAYPVMQP